MKKLKGHDIVIVKAFRKTIRTDKTDFWKVQDIAEALFANCDISDMDFDRDNSGYDIYEVKEDEKV